jgi:hypothetical protein
MVDRGGRCIQCADTQVQKHVGAGRAAVLESRVRYRLQPRATI